MGRGEGCAIPKTEKFECMKSRAIPEPEKFENIGVGCAITKSEKFENIRVFFGIHEYEKFDSIGGVFTAIPTSQKFECIGELCAILKSVSFAIHKYEDCECITLRFTIPKPEKFECIGEGCAIPKPEKYVCQEWMEGHKCTILCVIRKKLLESSKDFPNREKLLEIINQIERFENVECDGVIITPEKFEWIGEGCAIPKSEKFECIGEGCAIPIGEGCAIPNFEKFECLEECTEGHKCRLCVNHKGLLQIVNAIRRSAYTDIGPGSIIEQFDKRALKNWNLFKQWVELDNIKEARKRKGVEVSERLSSKRVKLEE
ncbi:uncharacterized protein LOC132266541 [Cornus florida]|uniref:uncharacterized protein LOC132266541 n=1 Tax=Cornus florida TaxID=4283 RepID=UPI0028963585|nr:uncharacterized protein LOC132266541 [Cornus florida]XP_059623418.1 uncharacterized protein LOC132266541 [Cornus florida]XP_059623419.1 uncharacterized protein LOC132266541 [Cornus florida]XP_059623420.1 uncharacterized protein LOC132266541 [Cornus florida]XP_059623421.1 uncharacterized protein LOC132266541 [Cornus florida]XP_059623422.1 uncharacterized protein LOC132266541 [Cornus florida]XP_059623423.1 uncharacterized protein LOC132266541 [Cornus florida]